jgi:hypothetical protein
MAAKKKTEKTARPFALEFLEVPSTELAKVAGGTTYVTMAITLPTHGHSHKGYDQV